MFKYHSTERKYASAGEAYFRGFLDGLGGWPSAFWPSDISLGPKKQLTVEEAIAEDWHKIGQDFWRVLGRPDNVRK